MNQILTLIRGLPGSGKSTLAKALVAADYCSGEHGCIHVEADMFFVDATGVFRFVPRLVPDAHAWCLRTTKDGFNRGWKHVIVSNTFVKLAQMQPYRDLARPRGAHVQIITCSGDFGSAHGVPENTIARMRAEWEPADCFSRY